MGCTRVVIAVDVGVSRVVAAGRCCGWEAEIVMISYAEGINAGWLQVVVMVILVTSSMLKVLAYLAAWLAYYLLCDPMALFIGFFSVINTLGLHDNVFAASFSPLRAAYKCYYFQASVSQSTFLYCIYASETDPLAPEVRTSFSTFGCLFGKAFSVAFQDSGSVSPLDSESALSDSDSVSTFDSTSVVSSDSARTASSDSFRALLPWCSCLEEPLFCTS